MRVLSFAVATAVLGAAGSAGAQHHRHHGATAPGAPTPEAALSSPSPASAPVQAPAAGPAPYPPRVRLGLGLGGMVWFSGAFDPSFRLIGSVDLPLGATLRFLADAQILLVGQLGSGNNQTGYGVQAGVLLPIAWLTTGLLFDGRATAEIDGIFGQSGGRTFLWGLRVGPGLEYAIGQSTVLRADVLFGVALLAITSGSGAALPGQVAPTGEIALTVRFAL